MVWDINAPYKAESKKIVWEVAPYLRGRGLDIGAGDFKILPHAISVDNMNHEQFGFSVKPDILVESAEKLDVFGSQTMDFVYSSHTLEHISNYEGALREWWRLVKQGGYLILYLPDEDQYPKVGQPGANPDHKWDVSYGKVIAAMNGVAGNWDLIDYQKRSQDDEYSLFFVFKKISKSKPAHSWMDPKPEKTACVVRYGAFGDLMQSSSVWASLKAQGYHVTVFSSEPGADVIKHDPHIDNLVLFDKDQVPNANLPDFWGYQKKKFTKFVNLSESVEGTLLSMPGRTLHYFPPKLRHELMNHNYLELQHKIAGVPFALLSKFYATPEEKQWARKELDRAGKGPVILWSLAGSSVHKTWPGLDSVIAALLLKYPEARIVLVGGPECVILEQGWEKESRVWLRSGKWTIRQSLAFAQVATLVIGPETGVLNAVAFEAVKKIVFLSHSTVTNLTRDWTNCVSLFSENTKCNGRGDNEAPACHQLHYGWDFCTRDPETHCAQCQADISTDAVWSAVQDALEAP